MDLKVEQLFQQKNLIFVSTINLDGSPQLTPVWGNYDSGYVLVNTAEGRLKHKNVLRDPRVAISVVDRDNPLNMTTIKGKVIEIIPDYDYVHANKLTKQYMGLDEYPFKRDGEKRIIFKIKPMKIFVMPNIK
uniref:Pyridoxamine 5'-phosphate oxidase family protein n=1 Tax=uncultured marine thaumarchaeote KM3_69_H10 TaxID=1456245 RepID=A0A075HGR3_9ARCH|nr:pyridoxamine 5'-phosphate oxidase family protein [uncultured marine thaumarchaeote KM3_69_H10]